LAGLTGVVGGLGPASTKALYDVAPAPPVKVYDNDIEVAEANVITGVVGGEGGIGPPVV